MTMQPAEQQDNMRRLLWAIPISVLIHNLEEYPRIVAYAQRHGIAINHRQMGLAVALATILPVPIIAAAARLPLQPRRLQLALALADLMAVNAGAHLAQTLILRDYSPGTITGIAINLPLAAYLHQQSLQLGITKQEARHALLAGALLMAPAAFVLQLIGRGIDQILPAAQQPN